MPTITRFAHLQQVHFILVALEQLFFNYLYAKSKNGIFKIRIEDTDKSRNIQTSVDSIIDGLNWLRIKNYSESIFSSKNIKKHLEIVKK